MEIALIVVGYIIIRVLSGVDRGEGWSGPVSGRVQRYGKNW